MRKKHRAAQQETGVNTTKEVQHVFTTPGASRYLGVSAATLRFWRANGEGPRFFHAGDRLVRYRRVDLDTWIESRMSN